MVSPMLTKFLGAVPDEQIKEIADKYVGCFLSRASRKRLSQCFGIELGPKSLKVLKDACL